MGTGCRRTQGETVSDRSISLDGVNVPRFLYGTAWKEEKTQGLTESALRQGFRGIDTANQRKHYFEAAVGVGLAQSIEDGVVTREDVFLQTKFTHRRGQDDRLPYDPEAPLSQQVEQSFKRSLEHLQTDSVDSYVLHGPTSRDGLARADWETWRAMEAIHEQGRTRFLGVSNVTYDQLRELCVGARIRPRFVQNRCYASRGWDRRVRTYCAAEGILYQGFSLLTANVPALKHPEVLAIARRHGRAVSQVVFRFALDVGMLPLTGTSNEDHMRLDLAAFDFHLDRAEVETIENLAANG